VSTDRPDLTEPHDPALDGLFRALTADGTAGELAGRTAALEMFRDSRRRPRRLRPPRFRLAVSMGTAAATLVLATFSVLIPASGHLDYRVIMPRTRTHGPAASGPVRIGARTRGRSGELGRVKTVR
jgi:hypothetical protein